jgi:hypothetical protein
MFKFVLSSILAGMLALPAAAGDHHHNHSHPNHDHDHHHAEGFHCSPVEGDTVQALLHEVHEVLNSGEHSHSIRESLKNLLSREGLKNWLQSFNVGQTVLSACRFYGAKKISHPKATSHLQNLAFVLPGTHVAEMISGPALSAMSMAMGWPEGVTGALGVTGVVISIPGIDPLCILVFATYPLTAVQNSVTFIREKTVQAITFTAKVSGFDVAKNLVLDQLFLYAYKYHKGELSMVADHIYLTTPGLGEVVFATAPDHASLIKMQFNRAAFEHLTEQQLKSELRFLPYSVRAAILDLKKVIDGRTAAPFYIKKLEENEVHWLPGSVSAKRLVSCAELLS